MANRTHGVWFSNAKLNNRWAFLINCISGLIVFISGMTYLIINRFTIDKILIEGDIRYITPVQLSYIAKNRLHGTFFTLDIAELKREFLTIPWVREVVVKRVFPDTLLIKIDERKAVARFGEHGLITNSGDIFNVADSNPNLPVFYTESQYVPLALDRFMQIQNTLNAYHQKITKLSLSFSRLTVVETDKNLTITFCDKVIDDKLKILNNYLNKLYEINPQLTTINLCYKNALAINIRQDLEAKKDEQ